MTVVTPVDLKTPNFRTVASISEKSMAHFILEVTFDDHISPFDLNLLFYIVELHKIIQTFSVPEVISLITRHPAGECH